MASAAATGRVSPIAKRSILLIGASRGLGLGLARSFAAHEWSVVATERRPSGDEGGLAAAAAAANGHIRTELVDINDPQTVKKLRAQLSGELFDVIFIVAGIRDRDPTRPTHEVSVEEAMHVFVSNAYSPICFAETFFDLLKPDGTLAIMTSRMGSLTLVSAADGTWELYRASKAALSMLTRCFYERHQQDGRTVLLLHPGWVKTDMGGKDAPVDLATSVEGLYTTLINWHGSGKQVFLDYQGNELPW